MARAPRILSGRFRGRGVRVVRGVRPTESRVREALFNIWSARIADCSFLDLFAGSGAMGFEALSRGAARVTWVEKQGQAVAAIRQTLEDLLASDGGVSDTLARGSPQLRVLRLDVPTKVPRSLAVDSPWDLIYADPPYSFGRLAGLASGMKPLLREGGTLAIEHSSRSDSAVFEAVAGLRCTDRRSWGDCAVTFFEPIASTEARS